MYSCLQGKQFSNGAVFPASSSSHFAFSAFIVVLKASKRLFECIKPDHISPVSSTFRSKCSGSGRQINFSPPDFVVVLNVL